jgi:hypothetical protein
VSLFFLALAYITNLALGYCILIAAAVAVPLIARRRRMRDRR